MRATKNAAGTAARAAGNRLALAPRQLADSSKDQDQDAPAAPAALPPAAFTARLVALEDGGTAWIELDEAAGASGNGARGSSSTQPARSIVKLVPEHVGRDVLVCRANLQGEAVIVGLLVVPDAPGLTDDPAIDLVVKRRRVVLEAKTEVVLRCGEGTITLGADGKVTIRGVDVVSSAQRTQRIRGGAVRIN
jgi:hypothetical protein